MLRENKISQQFSFTNSRVLRVLVAAAALSSLASAATLFSRPLPISNINGTDPNRSNIAPIQGSNQNGPYILGDDFNLGSGSSFLVDSISVWIVGNCPIGSTCGGVNTPQTEFSAIRLYGGTDPNISLLSSTYSSQLVQYTGNLNYKSENPGNSNFYPIFQITFSGLNLLIGPNVLYDFAIEGVPNGGNTLALHASNAGLSGNTQDGADNFVLGYQGGHFAFTAGAGNLSNYSLGADVNVLVSGTAVPEPGTIGIVATGLALVGWSIRRRRR